MASKIIKKLEKKKVALAEAIEKVKEYGALLREKQKVEKKLKKIENSLFKLGFSSVVREIKKSVTPSIPKPAKRRRRQPVKLSYERVKSLVYEFFENGTAVSVYLLLRHHKLPYGQRKELISFLEEGVEKGELERRRRKFERYKKRIEFDIYQPKGKFLPFCAGPREAYLRFGRGSSLSYQKKNLARRNSTTLFIELHQKLGSRKKLLFSQENFSTMICWKKVA